MKRQEFPYGECEDCGYLANIEDMRKYGPRGAFRVTNPKMACGRKECKLENRLEGALPLSDQSLLNSNQLNKSLKELK